MNHTHCLHINGNSSFYSSRKKVTTSEALDVDYLTLSLSGHLEMVVQANGTSGGARVDRLQLDFCLPCDFSSLHLPGESAISSSTGSVTGDF